MAMPDQTFGLSAFSPLQPQSTPDGLQRGIKEISGIFLGTMRGREAPSPSLAAAGCYRVERSLPALCSARCCEMMLMVIKLDRPFFKGSCFSDLLAKITISIRATGKQSGLWQPICVSVGANRWHQMDAPAISGVRCNDTVGCQFSR